MEIINVKYLQLMKFKIGISSGTLWYVIIEWKKYLTYKLFKDIIDIIFYIIKIE
jgi:hypothetical protein